MKKFGSLGVEILKRSVLQVLYERHNDSTYRTDLRQDEIRKWAGIPKQPDGQCRLTRGILNLLKDDKYVEPETYRTGFWKITEKGIAIIERGL